MVHLPFRLYVVRGQRFSVTVQWFRVQGYSAQIQIQSEAIDSLAQRQTKQ